jgi:hypothetical protein
MNPPLPLVELLQALTHGHCAADLWERGAVAHYGCVEAEAARVQLVHASVDAGDWHWSAVPTAIIDKATALLANAGPGGSAWHA